MSRMQRISGFLMLWHKSSARVRALVDGMYLWRYARDLYERVCVPPHILWGMNYKAWSLYWTSSGTSNQMWGVWNAGRFPPIQTLFLLCSRWLMDLKPFTPMRDVRFPPWFPLEHWNEYFWTFSFLRDNLDLTLRCWKAAEGPTQQMYQWNETKAQSCRGALLTAAVARVTPLLQSSELGGESEGCVAAEVMHSPFTLSQVTGRRAALTVRRTTEEWSF